MTHNSRLTWLAAAFVTFGVAAPAKALECEANADCPKGYECQEAGSVDCPDIACVDGDTCEPSDCTSETISECMPVECGSDADCAEGMVCYEQPETVCETTPCAADEECPDAESSCEEVSRNYCVPKYLLPCETSSDCGPGFTCEELESCTCSGGGGSAAGGGEAASSSGDEGTAGSGDEGTAGSGGGDGTGGSGGGDGTAGSGGGADRNAGDNTEESCTCEPSGEFACQLEVVACEDDSDCDNDFTCEENGGGTCWASSDGQSGCDEPDPANLCMPPYSDLTGSLGGGSGEASDNQGDDGRGTGAAGDTGAGEADDDGGHAKRSPGCQFVGGGGAPAGSLASLFAFAALALRRRRSR